MSEPLRKAMAQASDTGAGLAIICGGGSLPFALADAALHSGRRVVLFALRGWADPQRVAAYKHHWTWMGQFGRFMRLAAEEGCRDVAFIGSVARPALWQIRPDLRVIRLMPELFRLYRGGDDRLLTGIGRQFELHGFHLLGPKDVAPELAMPRGALGACAPNERDLADVTRGLALLNATSPFDIGQAVVVADNQVLAVEGPEGTDQMLARVAQLRTSRCIRTPVGTGVLVKSPKIGQDHRLDLPVIGPPTIEGVAAAGLAGVAVVAGSTIVAEPERIAAAADRAGIFVVGVEPDRAAQ
jgi:UDP-2,3-diacylglucosamine hydrolase